MAITFDNVFDVSAEERDGKLQSLRRAGYVDGLTSTSPAAYVAEILGSPAVPSGDITVGGVTLSLRRREVRLDDDSGLGQARVDLHYERSVDAESPGGVTLRNGGRVSLRQVTTQLDRSGNQITVEHDGVEQGGEISVLLPQAQPYRETVEVTSDPVGLALAWVGRVNSDTWNGKGPGMWLIDDASYEAYGSSSRWKFTWSFQLADDDQGWLPIVVYVDPETNRPPPGLVDGVGIKSVPYYQTANFGSKF